MFQWLLHAQAPSAASIGLGTIMLVELVSAGRAGTPSLDYENMQRRYGAIDDVGGYVAYMAAAEVGSEYCDEMRLPRWFLTTMDGVFAERSGMSKGDYHTSLTAVIDRVKIHIASLHDLDGFCGLYRANMGADLWAIYHKASER